MEPAALFSSSLGAAGSWVTVGWAVDLVTGWDAWREPWGLCEAGSSLVPSLQQVHILARFPAQARVCVYGGCVVAAGIPGPVSLTLPEVRGGLGPLSFRVAAGTGWVLVSRCVICRRAQAVCSRAKRSWHLPWGWLAQLLAELTCFPGLSCLPHSVLCSLGAFSC